MALPEVVALDTNCFLYLFEHAQSARGRFLVDQVLRPAERGERRVVTPALVVQELLTQVRQPGRSARGATLVRALEALPGLTVLPMTTRISTLAARLAAAAAKAHGDDGLSLADAVVVATAADADAVLLTNDRRLAERTSKGSVLVLDDLVASSGTTGLRGVRRWP